jgi:hypothetical protein
MSYSNNSIFTNEDNNIDEDNIELDIIDNNIDDDNIEDDVEDDIDDDNIDVNEDDVEDDIDDDNIDVNEDDVNEDDIEDNINDIDDVEDNIEDDVDNDIDDIEDVKAKNSYEWESLSEEWISKLLSNKFYIKNDCCTISIENALKDCGFKTSKNTLCKYISKYINSLSILEFSHLIKDYRLKYKNSINIGNWDPFVITNKKDFVKTIKGKDFFFQPDDITLHLISKSLGIDIVLLYSDFSIFYTNNGYTKIVTLYSIKSSEIDNLADDMEGTFTDAVDRRQGTLDNHYYFPLGLKLKKNIKTIFNNKHKDLLYLLDKKELLESHTLQAINNFQNNVRLNLIIDYIENKIKSSLSKTDKIIVFEILKKTL